MNRWSLKGLGFSLLGMLALGGTAQADVNDASLAQIQNVMTVLVMKQEDQMAALQQLSKEIGPIPANQPGDVRSLLKAAQSNLQNLRSQKVPLLLSKADMAALTKQFDQIRADFYASVDILSRAKSPQQARADMQALVAPIVRDNVSLRTRSDYLEWYMWALRFYDCPADNPNCSRPTKP